MIYSVIFALCNIRHNDFSLAHSLHVASSRIRPDTIVFEERRHWIRPVLISPADNKGEMGMN